MDAIDKAKAQTDPSGIFDKPADVAASVELSPNEKAKALQEWELEARLLEVATEEGMNKKNKPSLLPEIKEAQRKIGAESTVSDGSPTKF